MLMLWLPVILAFGGLISSYALTSKHGFAYGAYTLWNSMMLVRPACSFSLDACAMFDRCWWP